MEVFMQQPEENRAQSKRGRALVIVAAALMCAAALYQPNLAYAAPHGGGGFHGGGFHAGGFRGGGFGGFHGGGFHAGGFHGGGFHGNFHGGLASLHNGIGDGHEAHWFHGWRNGRFGWWWGDGLGWTYYPYPYGWDYGYDYSQPYASHYCSDPAGYYPYVTQCNTNWQTVPAS
jgi:hypothetical protein